MTLSYVQKSGTEQECEEVGEPDKVSAASDLGDEVDSQPSTVGEQSDPASLNDAEYINPRGIRFMAHQHQTKDGKHFVYFW